MKVLLPATIDEALVARAHHPDARVLLGGTDLLAQWQAGVARPAVVLALEHLEELRGIAERDGMLRLGAGVTHFALAHDPRVVATWPALAQAARTVGAPAIQSMGTIAGNIANASPAADLPPALLAYDAQIEMSSTRGLRRVPAAAFFLGYRRVDLAADELITSVLLPAPPAGSVSAYYKVGTRAAQSIARVALAGCVLVEGGCMSEVRLAAASVAAVPLRLTAVEDHIRGRALTPDVAADAGRLAARSIAPIDDVRSSAAYRRHAVGALVDRFLRRAGQGTS